MGEYLELVPKEAQSPITQELKRTLHPETRQAYGAVSLSPLPANQTAPVGSESPPSHRAASDRQAATAPVVETPAPTLSRVKVLRPAQVESWRESSFDLLKGCRVREVTDTIPGALFDELFKQQPTPPRRRR